MTEQEVIEYIENHGYISDDVKDMAIKALEKQIPKEIYHFDDNTLETSCCGIDVTNEDFKYCPECGQLLGGVEEIEDEEE